MMDPRTRDEIARAAANKMQAPDDYDGLSGIDMGHHKSIGIPSEDPLSPEFRGADILSKMNSVENAVTGGADMGHRMGGKDVKDLSKITSELPKE